MKLKLFLSFVVLLALGGTLAYTLSRTEGGFSTLTQRAGDFATEMAEKGKAILASDPLAGQAGAQVAQADEAAPQPTAPADASAEAFASAPPPVEPAPEAELPPPPAPEETSEPETPAPETIPVPAPEPAPVSLPLPAPEPQPAPTPEPEPAPEPQPAPELPAPAELEPEYGRPGEGHEPEKYPEQFARFCEKLDEQVKLNTYDYCPAIQVLLEATNDEFALEAWMKAAVAKGNAAAMHFLADAELSGVPADKLQSQPIREAYALMRRSAELGYDPSKCTQSECLAHGVGTRKDEAEAKKVLMEACKGGGFIPRLRWLLTTDRMANFKDRTRPEVAAEIERGNHHVVYFMSRLSPDSVTQMEWLQKAAELGNPDAFYDLAVVNFKTHPREAYTLLEKAAELHHAEALYLLASSRLEGATADPLVKTLGLRPDERNAMRLIKTAAAMRSPRAVYFMGRCYYEGQRGMPQDKALAYRHFSKALALRSPDSGAAMGLMLLRGEGVEKDVERGKRMITLAANSGYTYAIILMAYAHYNGLGTEADAAKAAELLQEAAALGAPEAYVYLAFITSMGGAGQAPNPRLAESYMRMASVDLGERAKELYASLEAAGCWEPLP